MAFKHTLKRGSTRPALQYPLPDVDLTGATATFIMSPRPGRPSVVSSPAVISGDALEYHWQHGDAAQDGLFFGEFEVTFPGGAIETFPSDDYIRVLVMRDLGDGGGAVPLPIIAGTGALVETGADLASGAGAVVITASGAIAEAGSDTAAGTGTVTAPALPAITLTGALVEAGADTAAGAGTVAPAAPPTVQNVQDGGYIGTTASITPDGEVTITNVSTFLSEADLQVFHYLVRADNMYGKNLTVKRATGNPNQNGGRLTEWQMAWSYDPHGAWFPFDNLAVVNSMVVASNNAPCTQGSVYIARRPVFTNTRWDAAIARWKASPHTSPIASGNADFVVGTLPVNQYAPSMPVYGFKFGTGSTPFVLTGNVHTGEHIGAYAMEGMVDWLLGDSPDAVWLRSFCTFYVYPKLNPQGRYAGSGRCEPVGGNTTNSNRIWYPPSANSNIPLSAVMVAAWPTFRTASAATWTSTTPGPIPAGGSSSAPAPTTTSPTCRPSIRPVPASRRPWSRPPRP